MCVLERMGVGVGVCGCGCGYEREIYFSTTVYRTDLLRAKTEKGYLVSIHDFLGSQKYVFLEKLA